MKIKNIAQRIIPNAGKKNFKSDEVERKILQNSLFTTVIQYPMGGSKVSETIKKKDKQKRSIYCVSIEKKKTKQSQQY